MTYDTTFTLGDFYLFILLFRETDFLSEQVIPLHQRKFKSTH